MNVIQNTTKEKKKGGGGKGKETMDALINLCCTLKPHFI